MGIIISRKRKKSYRNILSRARNIISNIQNGIDTVGGEILVTQGAITEVDNIINNDQSLQAIQFNGTNTTLRLGNPTKLDFTNSSEWCQEFLIKCEETATSIQTIASKRTTNTGYEIYLEKISAGIYKLCVLVAGNVSTNDQIIFKCLDSLTIEKVYHIAVNLKSFIYPFIYADPNITKLTAIRVLINGIEQPEATGSINTLTNGLTNSISNSNLFYLGSLGGSSRFFKGVIQDFVTYTGGLQYNYFLERAKAVTDIDFKVPKVTKKVNNVILDYDMNTDCDDAGDIWVSIILKQENRINLLAIITSTSDLYAAPCSRAFQDYWADTTPLGAYQGSESYSTLGISKTVRDAFRPTDLRTNYSNDVTTYRQALVGADDDSVTIIATGYLLSVYNLIMSPADSISTLTGLDLFNKKVKQLVVIGQTYPQIIGGIEYNAKGHPPSWKYVLENTTKPIIYSATELGEYIRIGPPTFPDDSTTNPLRLAYKTFQVDGKRQTWGVLALLYIAGYMPEQFVLSRSFSQTFNGSTGEQSLLTHSETANMWYLRYADGISVVQNELQRIFNLKNV